MRSATFLLIGCVTFLALTFSVVLINIFGNPYGYYGDKQFNNAPIFNAHIAKYYFLKEKQLKPNAFVLGSSNSMRMLPETIDSLFGVKAFNYGVYHASVEDFWCITNVILHDLKLQPKLFIICIDDWNFTSYTHAKDEVFKGAQNRLSYKPLFSKYLKDYSPITLYWSRVKTAISYDQFKDAYPIALSAFPLTDTAKKIIPLEHAFYTNGVRKKYADKEGKDVTLLAEKGEYKLTEYLKNKHQEALTRTPKGLVDGTHEDFKNFEPERLQLLEDLITLLEKNNVKVILNMMPINEYFQTLVEQTTNYTARIAQLKNTLDELKNKHPNILLVKDNHIVKSFNGNSESFFDQIHPTGATSNLMLYSIKNDLGNYAF